MANRIPGTVIEIRPMTRLDGEPRMPLIPFNSNEAITPAQAGEIAGVEARTVLRWAETQFIGRKIGGRWKISRPALEMYLCSDWSALDSYLDGERAGSVAEYFSRCGLLP